MLAFFPCTTIGQDPIMINPNSHRKIWFQTLTVRYAYLQYHWYVTNMATTSIRYFRAGRILTSATASGKRPPLRQDRKQNAANAATEEKGASPRYSKTDSLSVVNVVMMPACLQVLGNTQWENRGGGILSQAPLCNVVTVMMLFVWPTFLPSLHIPFKCQQIPHIFLIFQR